MKTLSNIQVQQYSLIQTVWYFYYTRILLYLVCAGSHYYINYIHHEAYLALDTTISVTILGGLYDYTKLGGEIGVLLLQSTARY